MKLPLPKSEYPMTRVTTYDKDATLTSTVDASISELDLDVGEDALNVAEFLDSRGEPVAIDKMAYVDGSWDSYNPDAHKPPEAKKPEPKPEPKNKPSPKAWPKPEPKDAE